MSNLGIIFGGLAIALALIQPDLWEWWAAVIMAPVSLMMIAMMVVRCRQTRAVPFAVVYVGLLIVYHVPSLAMFQTMPEIIGIERFSFYQKTENLATSVVAINLSILATAAGYLLASGRLSQLGSSCRRNTSHALLTRLGAAIIMVSSAVIAIYLWVTGSWSVGYDEFWDVTRGGTSTGGGSWMMVIGYVLVVAGMSIVAAFSQTKAILWNLALCAGLFAPLVAFGFRGVYVASCVGYLTVAVWRRPKLAVPIFFSLAGFALFILPAIAEFRARWNPNAAGELVYWWERPARMLAETDYATRSLVFTVNEIENHSSPLWFGASFVESAKLCLPFSSRIEWLASEREHTRPSIWMLAISNPWKLERGIGEGYSAIAETYINGGMPGTVIIFLAIGVYLAILEQHARNGGWRLAISIALYVWLLWWIRNDSANLLRPSLWSVAFLVAVKSALSYCKNPQEITGRHVPLAQSVGHQRTEIRTS